MEGWDDQDVQDQLAALRRYARVLTRDAAAAEDLVQDTLLKAIERADSFVAGRSLRSWLLSILHNQFISDRRHAASAKRLDDAIAVVMGGQQMAGTQEQTVYLQQIAGRFAALPSEQRAVLHLVAVEGLRYQDAAVALGVPIGTVMSRLSRARASLRREASVPTPTLRIIGGTDAS